MFYVSSLYRFKSRLHEGFFACDGDATFSKFVASPCQRAVKIIRGATLALPRASAARATVKLNELNFSRQNHRLCFSCSHQRAPATRQFPEKIASPSQAKHCSCSHGFTFKIVFLSLGCRPFITNTVKFR